MISWRRALAVGCGIAAGGSVIGGAAYLGLVTGAIPIDLGIGRRVRPLGPFRIQIDAPREMVFAVIAAPYGERVPRSLQQKVRVLEHGTDMVLAAHYTPVRGRLRATTVEVVRFRPPDRVDFRLVRGPVPHVSESFRLYERGDATTLTYEGDLGTDLWTMGQLWGNAVADQWESAVKASFDTIKTEAETRAGRRRDG
jgi:hypothetical protein